MGPDTEQKIKAAHTAAIEAYNLLHADIEALKNLITQDVSREVREIKQMKLEERQERRSHSFARRIWNALKHGWGVASKEIDDVMKE